MRVIAKTKDNDIATVYIAEATEASLFGEPKLFEFVESVQPPIPQEKKWVLIVSTLFGCPVKCKFCDSGGYYHGKLSKDDIFEQIDYLITSRYPDGSVPVEKFKIQFARMGEPSFNKEVLAVLEEFPFKYDAPGFLPSISTIAPLGSEEFFSKLIDIKNKFYQGNFQLQFSIHSTDRKQRDKLVPVKKWDFRQISDYGKKFFSKGDIKISLNFALAEKSKISPKVLREYFNPNIFLIKITPVNPTFTAKKNKVKTSMLIENDGRSLIEELTSAGFETILSIGELEENNIGSNCGQHIMNFLNEKKKMKGSYTYELVKC